MARGAKTLPRINKRGRFTQKWVQQSSLRKQLGFVEFTVVRETRDRQCYIIVMDGSTHERTYHKSFIEIIEEDNHGTTG